MNRWQIILCSDRSEARIYQCHEGSWIHYGTVRKPISLAGAQSSTENAQTRI